MRSREIRVIPKPFSTQDRAQPHWFRAEFTEPFRPGSRQQGRLTFPRYEHLRLEVVIETLEPQRRFAFRWHPNAIDSRRDYSAEPMTLVEFTLEGDGTLLVARESGVDGIPIERRAEALKNNSAGWATQMKFVEEYLQQHP